METISLFFLIEAIGTIAFASSGAMTAIRKRLDLLGVIILGETTAVGGGMLRDILLGRVPPSLFINPIYVIMAFVTVLVLFLIIRFNQHILTGPYIVIYERIMNIFDAVGLAAFTVTGIDTAMMAGYGDYRFLSRRRRSQRHHGRTDALYPEKACVCLRIFSRGSVLCISVRLPGRKYLHGSSCIPGGSDPPVSYPLLLGSPQGYNG